MVAPEHLRPISSFRMRRALIGILLAADRPLTVAEVVEELHRAGVRVGERPVKSERRVIADMLAYQVRAGRVRRVARATYRVVPESMSRSTRWRRLRWQRELDALDDSN